jgi:hypothetical protein
MLTFFVNCQFGNAPAARVPDFSSPRRAPAGIARAPGEEGFVEVRYGLRWHIVRH